jgi:eukaryotic-like serine/threonine-protein kinase
MHLWTEYEGRTIAEHYTLGKLLRSEGRNGFFATADKDGHPAVIRLTEAHFDEAEQLRRWRQVAEVHQDNLIEIEQVGQTTLEGVALTYALMEPDDANLADVLKERPMTSAETLQVGKAVLSALKALHGSGLVHEHVEPVNVLAVGETVKLRSDCVRECVADGEFNTQESCADLRRGDLHDFGTLLLRCLTLETEWTPAHNNLPDPFKRVIPRALDGTWSLEQLGAALDPTLFAREAPLPAGVPPQAPRPAVSPAPQSSGAATATTSPAAGAPAQPARPLVPPGVRSGEGSNGAGQPSATSPAGPGVAAPAGPALPVRGGFRPEPEEPTHAPSKAVWAIGAAAVLLVLWLLVHFLTGKPATTPAASSGPAPVVNSGTVRRAPATPDAPPVVPATAPEPTTTPTSVGTAPAAGASGWYVIAYTYNHADQAEHKVRSLRRVHNSLSPQVFTPTGHGPYLISLGGAMTSQDQAEAMWRHARRSGLPRDTFVRHY